MYYFGEMTPDSFGRQFKTLRLSLTDVCNLSCLYCVSEEEEDRIRQHLPTYIEGKTQYVNGSSEPMQLEDYLGVVGQLHKILGLETVRLTGGEPLLFKDLPDLIDGLDELGIPKIRLTTNGYLLQQFVPRIKDCNLGTINVSLDALNEDVFYEISRRRHLHRVLAGIDAALDAGFGVKLNCAVMKGVNDKEILPLMDYAHQKGITVRFLELMKMGHLHNGHNDYFFSESDILKVIGSRYDLESVPREKAATANYWRIDDDFQFGIISNESNPFCHDCNRLRLDSFGHIYGCLSSNVGITVKDCLDNYDELNRRLNKALGQKQKVKFVGSNISMKAIGG